MPSPRLIFAAVPLLIAGVLRLVSGGSPVFPTDDTYIAVHAARHLFTGVDPSYPEGAGLVGVTSPIHVLVLWAAMRFMPPLWACELVAWAGGAVYLLGISTFICARRQGVVDRAMLMTVGCLAGYTAQHLASGQETVWAMAAVVWSIHWLETAPFKLRTFLIAALLPWIRPELLMWSAVIIWKVRRQKTRQVLKALAIAGASVALYLIVNRLGGGTWLPNTVNAKREFFAEYTDRLDIRIAMGCVFLYRWALTIGPAALVLIPGFRNATAAVSIGVLGLMWLGLSLNGPGAFTHNYFRYAEPFCIPAILVAFSVLDSKWIRVLLAVSALWCIALIPDRWVTYRDSDAIVIQAQQDIAKWLNTNAPAGSRVLVHDAGYLSESTNFELVDLVGLKTPSSTGWHRMFTGPSGGLRRGEAVRAIACRSAPQFYVAFNDWERAFGLTQSLSIEGWEASVLMRRRVETPRRILEFSLYRLRVPASCPPR